MRTWSLMLSIWTEYLVERNAIAQSHGACRLNDGTVGKRVAEGDAHLDHVDAAALQREQHLGHHVDRRGTRAEVERVEFTVCVILKQSVYLIHFV